MLACPTGKLLADPRSHGVAQLKGAPFIAWQLSHWLGWIQGLKGHLPACPLSLLAWFLLVLASFSFLETGLFHTLGKMSPTAPGLPHTSSITHSLNWIGPGLGQVPTPAAGGPGHCRWQHIQQRRTGKKQFSVFTGW